MKPFVQLIGKYKLYFVTVVFCLLAGHMATATTRYVKPVATGTGTGSSWANASGDLQAMIDASAVNDQIWVMKGKYIPTHSAVTGVIGTDRSNAFVLKNGVSIYGGFAGSETSLFTRNYVLNVTTLNGNIGTAAKTDNCYHVVVAAGPLSGNGKLDGFTISDGYADAALAFTVNAQANAVVANRGGGIYIIKASPSIQNCTIKINEALNGTGGAGIFSGPSSSPVINDCDIDNNTTTGTTSHGAGIYMASAATISGCSFTGNTSSADGGGLYIATIGVVAVSDCNFTSNTAANGGGIENNSSSPTITNCTFSGNIAVGYGAGIMNYNSSSPTITDCSFTSNTASSGGGMENNNSSSPTITNCAFLGNLLSSGGSGAGMDNSYSSPTITNCIFSGNVAPNGVGGGMCNNNSSSPIITNCTIAGNKAGSNGGAIYNTTSAPIAAPIIKNCIIYGNIAGVTANAFNNTAATVTNSNVEGGYTGTGNINLNPLFISPQPASAIPATVGNYRLRSCSPAIDAGNNTAIAGYATDLDGNTRIINTTVDMGAYEKQIPLPDASGIVHVDATKNGDGKTWAAATIDLADALKAAKTNTAITQIWVAKGIYYPLYDAVTLGCAPADNRDKSFVLVNNVKVFGGFAGGETTTAGRDFVTNETILSGDIGVANDNTDNCYHVIIGSGAVGTAALDGFTITKGNANGSSGITVNGNFMSRNGGGGMYNYSSSPSITNSTFSGNLAAAGSGMYNSSSSSPTISNCTFSGNTASFFGGGMDNESSSPGITNCIFSGNLANSGGGGMYNYFSFPGITNSIFSGNNASSFAGGMYNNNSTPIISNCIIWGNAAPTDNPMNSFNDLTGSTNNIIQGGYPTGTNIIDKDPMFLNPQPASAAPTTTGNYHLHPCSPAVNMGNNAAVPGSITTDLDGNPRIVNTTVDMGAYEVQTGATVSITPAANIVYVDNSQFGDGSSWATATHNLADALKAAKTNAAIQQIWVKKGTYYPIYDAATLGCSPADNRDKSFVLVNNVKVFGGFAGGETTTTGRNFITNETILSADIAVANDNTDNCYHVAISAGAVGTAALDGFTVTKGNANGSGDITVNGNISDRLRGAGISNLSSSPAISNCIFLSNKAGAGAAIGNFTAAPLINNCTFLSNTAAGSGGALDNYFGSSASMNNCVFSSNTASLGGCIMNSGGSSLLVSNAVFSGNTATDGAAFYNHASTTATITNCLFKGNKSVSGAGLYIKSSSPHINNCTFAGNLASLAGGGIYNDNSSPVINNSIIWGNSAVTGNAILIATGVPVITNSLIEGGYAGGTNIINSDPLFINPQSAAIAPITAGNYRLHPCSPAVNTGNNSFVPGGITTDLDGNPRFVNSTVDMGAYEVQTGATVSVTSTANIVYVDNSQFGDGSSWASATHNLADALKAAKTNAAIQQIWVKKGTYYPIYDAATLGCSPADNRDKSFVLVNNVKLFGGFAGGETTTAGRNFVTNETVLSADIGVANDNTDNCYHVAISAEAVGTAALDGFTVTKGNANVNSFITVNTQSIWGVVGGGMQNVASSPNITNCTFSGNAGGGIYNATSSSPGITNCIFSGNTDGGMGNAFSSPIITNSIFTGNSGGGMANQNSSPMIINSTFTGNSYSLGGGMFNTSSSSPTILNCTLSGNAASFSGGGMYNDLSSSPTLINCTISGNKATVSGGGIYSEAPSPVIKNCIVYGNIAATDNTISPASGCAITNSLIQGGYPTGTNIINADPLFVAPQPVSVAPTILGDYRLQACSPAINLGNNSLIPAGITTDLDGNTRIKFIDVDMGAYEVQTQDLTQSTWRGINTNWNDRINWCGGYIPTASTNVTIPNGLVNYPITAAVNAVKNISLGNSTSVTVSNTGSLSINGAYANSGSNITNNGDWIMTGSAAGQSFPGSSGIISAMNNLEINNPSGIAFDKSFSITGALIPTAGNINVNNNIAITLKSSAAATANLAKIQPAASISYTGSGAFIVERFINTGTNIGIGQHAKSWQFLATPTTGQSIFQSWQESGTTPAGFGAWITGTGTGFDATTALPSLKYFDQVGFNWTPVINTGSALQNKLGYMLFVRGDRTVTAFNVAANNTVLRSKGQLFSPSNPAPSVPVPANTFQTFGNPYASRIEFNKVLLASTGINDVFYVWDPKLPGTFNLGGYQTITGITGYIPTVGTPPTGNAATAYYPAGVASPYIESGQAVFVKGSGTGGNVNFNENVKATGSRLVNKPVGNNDIANRQFLFTTLFTNTGEIADGNIIAFENGFGNEINENDATKLMNGGENFGLSRNGNILAVEAREPVAINDTLHYYMNNLRQQDYQLRFAPVNMDAVDKQAYLIDRCSGAVQQVIFTDSTYFDFTVSAATASSATDRFIIVFRLAAPVPVTFIDIKAYNQQENVNTEWQVADEINIYAYIIEKSIDGIHFDSIGVSAAHGNNGSGIIKYDYPDTHPVAGVNFYRIKSIGLNNEINYSKIVSVKRSKINAGISIYPNPVIDGNLQLWFTDMPGGTYTIRLFNTVGQLIVKEQIGYDGYNNMVNIRLNKLVAHGNYNVEINGPQNIRITMPVTN